MAPLPASDIGHWDENNMEDEEAGIADRLGIAESRGDDRGSGHMQDLDNDDASSLGGFDIINREDAKKQEDYARRLHRRNFHPHMSDSDDDDEERMMYVKPSQRQNEKRQKEQELRRHKEKAERNRMRRKRAVALGRSQDYVSDGTEQYERGEDHEDGYSFYSDSASTGAPSPFSTPSHSPQRPGTSGGQGAGGKRIQRVIRKISV